MPVTREIEILTTPLDPCTECGDVLEDLVGALQQLIESDRDGYLTSQCKACGKNFKGQTKIIRHLDNKTMAPAYRTEKERLTGLREKPLAQGEMPPDAPRPAAQEAIRVAIKAAKAKSKPKRTPGAKALNKTKSRMEGK
jgi:hypothetical protein